MEKERKEELLTEFGLSHGYTTDDLLFVLMDRLVHLQNRIEDLIDKLYRDEQ